MKTSTVGLVLAAILMVVAGVGFGIAQAAGNQSYDLMLSFGDQDANPYIGNPYIDVGQEREAVETGSLPAETDMDASIFEIDGDTYYRTGGILHGPY